MTASASLQIQIWSIDRLVFYARNPRKNDAAVIAWWPRLENSGSRFRCSHARKQEKGPLGSYSAAAS
jgi:hypothetical protein